MKETERSLDPQLWHVCAGGMVQMPPVNSKVFYFPQGHAEHCSATVDFSAAPRLSPLVPCRVAAVKYLADSETDEVYSKIRLVPLGPNEVDYEDDDGVVGSENSEKPASFAKTLTQSDANNGGGFSVPRYCAETIFPRLDYSADPPVQTVIAKDVHGEVWKFRHIYRGTPRRHLLTTGWSTFVNQKKLVAGDLIVFLRAENGELCVGIRRSKRGINGSGAETPSGWSSGPANCVSYGGFSRFLREDENMVMRNVCNGSLSSNGGLGAKGRIMPESVIEAVSLAAKGQPFEVVYYPRASTPEFCVKASSVRAAIRIQWCSGMRFKMAFETEDSSRISWFMGTVASVQVADHLRWPNSPWRLLQVTWDEPDLLQNVKRVSPWLVELVSSMPVTNLSPFSPSRKKLRLLQHLDGQFPIPSFSGNPLGPTGPFYCHVSDNNAPPAGIQGARQTHFGISLQDLHFNNKLQSGLFQSRFDPSRITHGDISNKNVSCLLTVGSSSPDSEKLNDNVVKKHQFLLFGQPILTEQQISRSSSSDLVSQSKNSTEVSLELQFPDFPQQQGFKAVELTLDTGHCKVFMESEDVGRTLDLCALGSYEELYRRLRSMFGVEKSELLSHVLYRDATGAVRQAGDEPFSDFAKSAKRLTIRMDSASNKIGRTWFTGTRKADNGLDSSNKRGPLSIFV